MKNNHKKKNVFINTKIHNIKNKSSECELLQYFKPYDRYVKEILKCIYWKCPHFINAI